MSDSWENWKPRRVRVPRKHLVTHPILGIVTWKQIQTAAKEMGKREGKRLCSWCFQEVEKGRRTRCGKPECSENIGRAYDWGRCQKVCLSEAEYTCECGARACTVDHIVPVSLGGLGDKDNLRALCIACHRKYTTRLAREKERYVAAAPLQPNLLGNGL